MIVLPLVLGSALAVPPTPPSTTSTPSVSSLSAAVLQEEEYVADGTWHGHLDIGLSKSEGNADIETYAATARAVRELDAHRYTLEGLWYYATQDDVRTQRRALGFGKYDQFISEKTYVFLTGLAETNEQAELDLRWTVGAGIGQQWRDDDQWRIGTEVGLSWFDEEFDNGDQVDYLAVRAAWNVWTQITSTLAFGHEGEIYPSLDDSDDVYGRANTYFEAQLSASMIAKLSWILAYDNTPAVDDMGDELQRVDNLYLLSVGWKF